ncbi:WD40-repeat-containing domain protein [Halteromyces radiatus]|uniref:WD40-repeat-containing domain protein n=1 Tax=Halteromyces radiatus TaxID=101107 RepID=UPI00221EBD9F|nr:WD40-repeat-containing domain protein [Halteromyces radiatus]KAI8098728.1 WD40-repeat-containing domain protein [Halteromyces radiatus]
MGRIVTFKKRVDFPVYGLQFSMDNQLVAAGGDGASTTGTKNKIIKLMVDAKKRRLKETSSVELSEQEDCAMSVATHPQLPMIAAGINSSHELIEQGQNQQCRLFDTHEGTIKMIKKTCTSSSKNPEEYQKITRFSHSGKYLLTGTTDGKVSVLKVPELQVAFPPLRFQHVQDCDIDTAETHVAIATSKAMIILSIQDGTVIQVIDSPRLNRYTQCEYRACRFVNNTLYAIVNPSSSKGSKGAFLCVWSIKKRKPYPLRKATTCRISRKNITTFCLSDKGDLLAYACTDLSVGLVDTSTLRVIIK